MIDHRDRAINSRAPKLSQNASLQQESSLEEYEMCMSMSAKCGDISHLLQSFGGQTLRYEFEIWNAYYSHAGPIHIRFFENFVNCGL